MYKKNPKGFFLYYLEAFINKVIIIPLTQKYVVQYLNLYILIGYSDFLVYLLITLTLKCV